MNYVFEMEYSELPKMLNPLLRSTKANFIVKRETEKWEKRIFNELVVQKKIPVSPLKKAKLYLTRHSSKEPDLDGLYGSMKVVIDAIKNNKIIEDDKPSIVDIKCLWRKAKQKEGKVSIKVVGISPSE